MKWPLYNIVGRRIANILLALLVFFVSNPPTYFTLLLTDLQVSLYLDIPDLDEDVFVRTCASGCDHGACYTYKEESRGDHGRREKVLFKIKFDFFVSQPSVTVLANTLFRWPNDGAAGAPGYCPILERPPNAAMRYILS